MKVKLIWLLCAMYWCTHSFSLYSAQSPENYAAMLPEVVKNLFAPTASQLNTLKSKGVKAPTELYMPTAQAAINVAHYAAQNRESRDQILQGLTVALKLSFWNPEFWGSSSKKPTDQRYNLLFSTPQTNDGADKLVGNVFIAHSFNEQGIDQSIVQIITQTLYGVRANPGLQGSIITQLTVFLKKIFDERDNLMNYFNSLTQPSLAQYAGLADVIIATQVPLGSPLTRGIKVNILIAELENKPEVGASESGNRDASFAFVQEVQRILGAINQEQNIDELARQYGRAVQEIIAKFNDLGISPYIRYHALNQIRVMLLASPLVTPLMRSAGALEKQSSGCSWYEIHCWVQQGVNELNSLIDDNITSKMRDVAKKINMIADTLTCLPDTIADSAKEVIGGKKDICKNYNEVLPSDKVCMDTSSCTKTTCKDAGKVCITQKVATMQESLIQGAQKIDKSMQGFGATKQQIQQQRTIVQKLNLGQYGITDLNDLEKALLQAFTSLENALSSLAEVNTDTQTCSSGVLCNLKKSLEDSALKAQQGIQATKANIEKLKVTILHPDGNRESLVQKLKNIARKLE